MKFRTRWRLWMRPRQHAYAHWRGKRWKCAECGSYLDLITGDRPLEKLCSRRRSEPRWLAHRREAAKYGTAENPKWLPRIPAFTAHEADPAGAIPGQRNSEA